MDLRRERDAPLALEGALVDPTGVKVEDEYDAWVPHVSTKERGQEIGAMGIIVFLPFSLIARLVFFVFFDAMT